MLRQCSGITKAGKRCNSLALPGSDFCISHDPTRVTDLAEYRKRGGKGRSNDARARKALTGGFKDVATAQAVLLQVLTKLYKGDFDPGLANAMANVARAIDALAKTNATAAMEEQLAALARQVAELSRPRSA